MYVCNSHFYKADACHRYFGTETVNFQTCSGKICRLANSKKHERISDSLCIKKSGNCETLFILWIVVEIVIGAQGTAALSDTGSGT